MHLLLLLNSDVYATLLNSEVCPGRGQCTGSTWLEEDLGKSGNDANMAEHDYFLEHIDAAPHCS